MVKLEMIFDYVCPYCLKGYNDLLAVLPDFPGVEMQWRPCEINPRTEARRRMYSDLCIRGMFFAQENGVDLHKYHRKLFAAFHENVVNVEDVNILADYLKDVLDANAFRTALNSGKYVKELEAANAYAVASGAEIVPAFRCNGRKLDSAPGIGVTREQLKRFLSTITA